MKEITIKLTEVELSILSKLLMNEIERSGDSFLDNYPNKTLVDLNQKLLPYFK